jgi:hypothetical protein
LPYIDSSAALDGPTTLLLLFLLILRVIQVIETGRIQLVLRFPAPDRGRSRIEQTILRRYLIATAPASDKQNTEEGPLTTFYRIVNRISLEIRVYG